MVPALRLLQLVANSHGFAATPCFFGVADVHEHATGRCDEATAVGRSSILMWKRPHGRYTVRPSRPLSRLLLDSVAAKSMTMAQRAFRSSASIFGALRCRRPPPPALTFDLANAARVPYRTQRSRTRRTRLVISFTETHGGAR
jgi:hypothetical protein